MVFSGIYTIFYTNYDQFATMLICYNPQENGHCAAQDAYILTRILVKNIFSYAIQIPCDTLILYSVRSFYFTRRIVCDPVYMPSLECLTGRSYINIRLFKLKELHEADKEELDEYIHKAYRILDELCFPNIQNFDSKVNERGK